MCGWLGVHFILIKNPFLVVYSITNFRIYHFAVVQMATMVSENWHVIAFIVLFSAFSLWFLICKSNTIESKNWNKVDCILCWFKPVASNSGGMLLAPTHNILPTFAIKSSMILFVVVVVISHIHTKWKKLIIILYNFNSDPTTSAYQTENREQRTEKKNDRNNSNERMTLRRILINLGFVCMFASRWYWTYSIHVSTCWIATAKISLNACRLMFADSISITPSFIVTINPQLLFHITHYLCANARACVFYSFINTLFLFSFSFCLVWFQHFIWNDEQAIKMHRTTSEI